jgi:hypothetical protein
MYSFPNNIGGATVLVTGKVPTCGAQIQNVTLEKLDIIKTLNNISLIKIDLDGLELRVILGAENLIKQDKPIILFESIISSSENRGSNVRDILKKFGYKDFLAFQKWPNSRLKNRNLRFAVNFVLRMLTRETSDFANYKFRPEPQCRYSTAMMHYLGQIWSEKRLVEIASSK